MSDNATQGFVYMGVVALIYLMPTLTAYQRRHHNRMAVFILNLFLGWTVLGWILALVWSCTYTPPQPPRQLGPLGRLYARLIDWSVDPDLRPIKTPPDETA